MELFGIVAIAVLLSDRFVSGRLGSLRGIVPEKVWSSISHLLMAHQRGLTKPSCAVAHRGGRTRKGYFYVNTAR